MTVNLSIKGVPEAVAERLRLRAESNHRSLQGELMAIVEQAVSEAGSLSTVAGGARGLRQKVLAGVRRGGKSVEQIAAEHLHRYPEPFRDLPRAVDIIRAERDAR